MHILKTCFNPKGLHFENRLRRMCNSRASCIILRRQIKTEWVRDPVFLSKTHHIDFSLNLWGRTLTLLDEEGRRKGGHCRFRERHEIMIPIIGISKQAGCICLQIYIYTTESVSAKNATLVTPGFRTHQGQRFTVTWSLQSCYPNGKEISGSLY